MKNKGFTLIELLVVIAIIGILASIVLASLNGARQKGRDARRISDIKQIQLALELYYDAYNAFPVGNGGVNGWCLTSAQLETPGYISKIPTDPSYNTCYSYVPYGATTNSAVCSSYHLGATLESVNHQALTTDSDLSSPPTGYQVCTAPGSPASGDFNGLATGYFTANGDHGACGGSSGTASPGTETCYDVRP